MLQLLAQDRVANASKEPTEHVEDSVPTIASEMPPAIQDALASIRIGLRDVANETVRTIQHLSQATVEQALEIGQRLWQMQRDLKRKEYGAFLGILGWATAKARKYINLAKTFADFSPSQLIRVELTTLLSLCQKRYSSVVAQLREVKDITQQLVEQLIKENRQVRSPKQDPITGWKRNRAGGGRRYEVILHDEVTGLSIEQQAEAEGVLPQRVIAEAVELRSQHKSNSMVQVSEYRAAQLEELPVVVEHARNLVAENRLLMHQLQERERKIAELEAKLASGTVPSEVEPSSVQKDEVEIASGELSEYLEEQVKAIMNEQITEYGLETIEATACPEPEQEFSCLKPASFDQQLVEPVAENLEISLVADGIEESPPVQELEAEPEPQVFHVGVSVKIVSSRHGEDLVCQVGVVTVANEVGCVVDVAGQTRWFGVDELVLASAATQVSSEQEKGAAPAI